jgi:prevent-host-death family protein
MAASSVETCSLTDLRRSLSRHIEHITRTGSPLYITRRGKPIAVLLSIALFERLQEERQALVNQLRSAPPDSLREARAEAVPASISKGSTSERARSANDPTRQARGR